MFQVMTSGYLSVYEQLYELVSHGSRGADSEQFSHTYTVATHQVFIEISAK